MEIRQCAAKEAYRLPRFWTCSRFGVKAWVATSKSGLPSSSGTCGCLSVGDHRTAGCLSETPTSDNLDNVITFQVAIGYLVIEVIALVSFPAGRTALATS